MTKIWRIRVAFGSLVLVVCAAVILSLGGMNGNAHATSSTDYSSAVIKKALLRGVYRCYTGNNNAGDGTSVFAIARQVDKLSTFSNFSSLIIGGTATNTIALPSGLTNIADNNVSCKVLFLGDTTGIGTETGTFEGLFKLANKKSYTTNKAEKITLLEGMGYQMSDASKEDNQQCGHFTYNYSLYGVNQSNKIDSDEVCAKIGANDKIESFTITKTSSSWATFLPAFFTVTNDGKIKYSIAPKQDPPIYDYTPPATPVITDVGVGSTWTEFWSNLRSKVSDRGAFEYTASAAGEPVTFKFSLEGNTTSGNYQEDTIGDAGYEIKNFRIAANKAINYLSNGAYTMWQSLGFSDAEKVTLLTMSLKSYFYDGAATDTYWACEVTDWADYGSYPATHAIKISPNGTLTNNCRLNPSAAKKTGTIYGFSGNFFDSSGSTKLTLEQTIAEINRLVGELPNDTGQLPVGSGETANNPSGETPNGGSVSGGSTSDGSDAGLADGCISNAGVLGWIMCPVIRLMGAAASGIYEDIADNYLMVKSNTMTSPSLRKVWGDFQGYANIVFAIVLAVVILSQVTGIGLNNYNIKKILPRLIITIVLVNLSFIICSIAVDVSNILGVQLNRLFSDLSAGGLVADNLNLGTMIRNTIDSIGLTAATGAVTIGAVAVIIKFEAWKYLLPPLLLTVLAALISILFFYVILGVRQAAIIILIAVSPLAIICYALPNTQQVFNKWLKLFGELLMVFPICGLLMGGSNFASRLLLGAGGGVGFMYYLVAMLMSVVPLFFVPTVLKRSMHAMGDLGMKLSQMGNRAGAWVNRTARDTRAYKDFQQEGLRNSNMLRDKDIMKSNKSIIGRLAAKEAAGTLTPREKKQLSRARYRYNRAFGRNERAMTEEAMAEANANRDALEPGTDRYNRMVASMNRTQRDRDDAGQISMYQDGLISAFDGSGDMVNADSLNSLEKEHFALLEHLADNPNDESAASRLRAVQTLLGRIGPNGFDRMENNYGRLMAHHSQFTASSSTGIGAAAAHLSRNFAGQIKANSRSFDKLLGDISDREFSHQGSFASSTFDDAFGKRITSYRSSHYSTLGTSGLKAESVNDLGDSYLDNLLEATRTGDLRGKDLEQVVKVFDEARRSDKITLKGDVEQRISSIMDAAYASGLKATPGSRTMGSSMIGQASSDAIDNIVKQINNAGSWATMTADQKSNTVTS